MRHTAHLSQEENQRCQHRAKHMLDLLDRISITRGLPLAFRWSQKEEQL